MLPAHRPLAPVRSTRTSVLDHYYTLALSLPRLGRSSDSARWSNRLWSASSLDSMRSLLSFDSALPRWTRKDVSTTMARSCKNSDCPVLEVRQEVPDIAVVPEHRGPLIVLTLLRRELAPPSPGVQRPADQETRQQDEAQIIASPELLQRILRACVPAAWANQAAALWLTVASAISLRSSSACFSSSRLACKSSTASSLPSCFAQAMSVP